MIFKFLGNTDAPDWVLSEMYTLSLVSSVRIKFILQEIYKMLLGKSVDYTIIDRHLIESKINESQKKSVLMLLAFILENSAKFNTEPEDLHQELSQLGAPHAHASTITRLYRDIRPNLRKYMSQNIVRFNVSHANEYRSDIVLLTSDSLKRIDRERISIRFNQKCGENFLVSMTAQQANDLIRELSTCIDIMKSYKQ